MPIRLATTNVTRKVSLSHLEIAVLLVCKLLNGIPDLVPDVVSECRCSKSATQNKAETFQTPLHRRVKPVLSVYTKFAIQH